ncbi:MAG: hypothetical protein ACFE75_00825 [Candidatus Hodarchaeota archaeon]
MVKKGKYKLFSYLIENHLIYYKSLGKNDKIIAFAIIDDLNNNLIETVLNEFLRKRLIQYYSIQIDISEKYKTSLFLNFEDTKKESIIKAFNIIQQEMVETNIPFKFLKEKNLEKTFITSIFEEINLNTSITKTSDSILISDVKKSRIFNFFRINLDTLRKKKEAFIYNFSNLIRNLGRKGLLIFHFRMDHHENIKLTCYFAEKCEINGKSFNMEKNINNFFYCNLIKRQEIKIKAISNLFWRLGITGHNFFFIDFENLFNNKKLPCSLDLLEINELVEHKLLKNQIEYIKLSKNLYFINQNNLFLILQDLDSNYIYEIIEKYYPKYFIYILILNYLGYEKLLEIESINLIENIEIINPMKIQKFSYEKFKRYS